MQFQTLLKVLNIFRTTVLMGTDDVTFLRYGSCHAYLICIHTHTHSFRQQPLGVNKDVCSDVSLIFMMDRQQEAILTADLTQRLFPH